MSYLFGFIIFVISFVIGNELPIGLTEDEKRNLHIIDHMGRQTEPPPYPIRSIAEYEPMQGVLIRYPFGISTALIREMAEDVMVYCLVSSGSQNSAFNSMSSAGVDMNKVEFIIGTTDSYWTRDYGPWWVRDGNNNISVVDFTYNRPRPNDNNAPYKVANHLSSPYFSADFVSTGGNYMTDGLSMSASTHIAYTENNECNTNNNSSIPLAPCEYVDQIMSTYYGIQTYHVMADPNNEYIDHIDCWGKYLSPTKVLIREVPTWHSQYDEIEEVADYFANMQTSFGQPWEVFRVYTSSNQPYTNSLILNDKVFVPIMNNSYDDDALAVYAEALPGYEILGFTGSWQSTDALHCRVKGIPDLGMLEILHIPIIDQIETSMNYFVSASINDISQAGIIEEEVKVFWSTDTMSEPESIILTNGGCVDPTDDSCFTGYIPSQNEDVIIYYYIQAADQSGRFARLPMAGYYSFQTIAGDINLEGDVNLDGIVNILDIILVVNMVLSGEYSVEVDLNMDEIINVLDVILLVNIVLQEN